MPALVVNTRGVGFDVEDIHIAAPVERKVLVDVRASGLCHTDLTIAQEEIFGPVLSVIAYDSEDDAIWIANDSKS